MVNGNDATSSLLGATEARSKSKSKRIGGVMYIEEKPGLTGHARIGSVTFSGSRKTSYILAAGRNR